MDEDKDSSSEKETTESLPEHQNRLQKYLKEFLIGNYKVIRSLGEGGMGTVYLAMRADDEYKKYVAVKLIREGRDSEEIITRFRRERQILAGLDHPNIARLIDGGTTAQGFPYFVMEYIQGRPLNDYCDSHKLTTKERLELFRTICAAVQFAHQNLVVHRDLKPANILVTSDGIPKLLDFGIAKFLNPGTFADDAPPTATEFRAMTPEYASPEQVRGDPLTTASDIYSLGVVLYELLTGTRPIRLTSRNPAEIYSAICEQEPTKPSSAITAKENLDPAKLSALRNTTTDRLYEELRGDLDNIIMMALRKEPQRRYPSAETFSADIRRFLEAHPVHASKGTRRYRASKYIRRHKTGVTVAAGIVLLLITFAATATYQSIRIAEQRDAAEKAKFKAEAESQKAKKVSAFLVDMFKISDPGQARGNTITAREMLDRGAKQITTELEDQPEVRAEWMNTMAKVYLNLGLYDKALPLGEESLKLRKRILEPIHPDIASTLSDLGMIYNKKGNFDRAESMYRQALEMHQKLYGDLHPDTARSMSGLAIVIEDKGNYAKSEPLHRKVLEIRRKIFGNNHPDVAAALNTLAWQLQAKGDFKGCELLYLESLGIYRKTYGNNHPHISAVLGNLGLLKNDQGDHVKAESYHREAIEISKKVLGDDHEDTAGHMSNLAILLKDLGRYEESESLLRQSLKIERKALGNVHPEVSKDLYNLAAALQGQGKYAESEELLRESLEIDRKTIGIEHRRYALHLVLMGRALGARKSFEAEKYFADAIAIYRRVLGNSHPYLAGALMQYGDYLNARLEFKRARIVIEESLMIYQKSLEADHPDIALAEAILADCMIGLREFQKAEDLLQHAYPIFKAKTGENHPDSIEMATVLVRLYDRWGKPEKANQYRKLAEVKK
jgi:serine/threonine-protein kinase